MVILDKKNSKTLRKKSSSDFSVLSGKVSRNSPDESGGTQGRNSSNIESLPVFRKIDFDEIGKRGDFSVLDNLPEGIFVLDPGLVIMYANKKAASFLSKSPPELNGYYLQEYIIPVSNVKLYDFFNQSLNEGEPARFEGVLKLSNHSPAPYNFMATPFQGKLAVTFAPLTNNQKRQNSIEGLTSYYKAQLEAEIDGIHIMDEFGQILVANESFCGMLGYSLYEMVHLGLGDWDIQWANGRDIHQSFIEIIQKPAVFETRHKRKDGTFYEAEISALGISLKGKNYVYASARDITQRKKKIEEISRLNQLNAFISQVNHLILRVRHRSDLFNEVCQIAVKTGKFRMAWIGVVNPLDNSVHVETWDGHEEGYLAFLNTLPLNDLLLSGGPVGRSLKHMQAIYSNDFTEDVSMEPWRDEAIKRNYFSAISIPFKLSSMRTGVLVLYSEKKNFFINRDEVTMLEMVGANISYSLEKIQIDEERVRALLSLEESEMRYRTLVDSAPEGILVHRKGRLLYGNPAVLRIFGFNSINEIQGKRISELAHPKFRKTITKRMATLP
ncbi:MAG: PAS domain S-box protein, partial [Bacteroidota bacterium]|nr:PAS domain S-box protein [Bacteroidota bacterium]